MMFFCTSVVPAATVTGMLSSHWRCISPSSRQSGSSSTQQPGGAEHLQAHLPGELLHLRVVDAGDRRLDRRHLTRRLDRDRAVVQQLGRLDARGQRGQARRAPRDRRPTGGRRPPSRARTARGARGRGWRARVPGDADALEREPLPHQRPPRVLVAEAIGDRDDGVVEEDLAELALAGHARDRAHGDAGRAHVDQEHRDARPASSPRCWCAPAAGSGRRARRRSCSRSSDRSRRSGRRRAPRASSATRGRSPPPARRSPGTRARRPRPCAAGGGPAARACRSA